MTNERRTRIAVYSLGGTIAMTPQPEGGVAPALSAAELLAAVPALADLGIDIEAHDFRRLPGASLGFRDLLALTAEIEAQLRTGIDGVVVTQGTDTIEETAYLLDLVHSGDAPIVVTGAMRGATAAGADGPANVLAALRVAASTDARGLGCLVVFADEIHAARYVRKTHTTSVKAFRSYPGPVGYLAEAGVYISMRPARSPYISDIDPTRTVRTAVVPATLGDDGTVLQAVVGKLDGLVVAGFGVGHVPATWVPTLAGLAERIPVVLASRTGTGPVLAATYGFVGSESDLRSRGLLSAGSLDPFKARILLHLLLMASIDRASIETRMGGAAAAR